MSTVGDALKALKRAILLEERISSQSKKLEEFAGIVVKMDKRLTRLEGRMEGFFAAASALRGSARRPAKLIEAPSNERPGPPPDHGA